MQKNKWNRDEFDAVGGLEPEAYMFLEWIAALILGVAMLAAIAICFL